MVQILPPKYNIGTQVGQSLGQGLQAGMQQGIQRGLLQQALGKLSSLPKGAEPLEILTNLISSTAGIPGAERYVAPIYDILLKQLAGEKAGETPPPPGGGIPENPQMQGQAQGGINASAQGQPVSQPQTQPKPQSISPENLLAQSEQEGLNLPQPDFIPKIFDDPSLEPAELGMGPIAPTYSPELIHKIDLEDAKVYGLGNSPRVKRMEAYNAASRARNSDIINAASVHGQLGGQKKGTQASFRKVLSDQLGGESADPKKLAFAERVAQDPLFKNIGNDALRAEKVIDYANNILGEKSAFKETSYRPNPILSPQKYKQQLNNIKTKADNLIKWGFRQDVYDDLASNGWSENEIAKQLNPLNPSVIQTIKKLPHFAIARYGTKEARQKGEQQIKDTIEQVVKPGKLDPKKPDIFEPGTSLLLVRDQFINKGVDALLYDNLFTKLIEEGKLKLDPWQNREYQLMTSDPSRTKSIYELIFE